MRRWLSDEPILTKRYPEAKIVDRYLEEIYLILTTPEQTICIVERRDVDDPENIHYEFRYDYGDFHMFRDLTQNEYLQAGNHLTGSFVPVIRYVTNYIVDNAVITELEYPNDFTCYRTEHPSILPELGREVTGETLTHYYYLKGIDA